MQTMVFVKPGQLEWDDRPTPALQGAGEALVRPLVMGRCDLDVAYLKGQLPLAAGEPIGHEIVGEVTEIGDEAARWFALGQRVMVSAQICCGRCRMCTVGATGRCEAVPLGASYGMGRDGNYGGGVSELVRVPFAAGMLTPLPENVDPVEIMGLVDMATDAWRTVGPPLRSRPGGTVLVMGGATPVIGVYAAGLAMCLGAGRVLYIDGSAERRGAASRFGAEVATSVHEIGDALFDIVVDSAGDADRLLEAIKVCGPAAHVTSVAPTFAVPALPVPEMYYKGVTWTIGRPDCKTGQGEGLRAWSSGGFRPETVGPVVRPFAEAPDAWNDPALYVAVHR